MYAVTPESRFVIHLSLFCMFSFLNCCFSALKHFYPASLPLTGFSSPRFALLHADSILGVDESLSVFLFFSSFSVQFNAHHTTYKVLFLCKRNKRKIKPKKS